MCYDTNTNTHPPPAHNQAGDMALFASHFARVKAAGLGVTLHIAEVNYPLSLSPSPRPLLRKFR